MRVAFHAPLKPVDHPVPSGDRRVARGFLDLLHRLGHEVILPPRFRSFDRAGDAGRQLRLAGLGDRLAERVITRLRARPGGAPQLWLTYHCYHKAPDLLGPPVAARLGIPYVIAEGSISERQAHGPWAIGYGRALVALRQADLVLAMTERDRRGLATHLPGDRLLLFPPFLDVAPFRLPREETSSRPPVILAVGMMREDVKRRSFEALLDAMALVLDLPWQLVLVGDGPARAAIEARAASRVPGRARFEGALSGEAMPMVYSAADLYLWPGFAEAYGMAILEAQASGLPVVAGRQGGIPEIVQDGRTGLLATADDPSDLARAVRLLLMDPQRRRAMGRAAARQMAERHDLSVAAARLRAALDSLVP